MATRPSKERTNVWSEAVRAVVFKEETLSRERVRLVSERPMTIVLNGREIVTLLCIPDYPAFLAAGFLFSEGLVVTRENIEEIIDDKDNDRVLVTAVEETRKAGQVQKRIVTTGCGKGTSFGLGNESLPPLTSELSIDTEIVFSLMKQLLSRSDLYRETRGVHNTALGSLRGIEVFHTDVGRHNAVDKIHGQCILEARSTRDKVLVTTGRLTSEIVIKCARMGIPILISRHAATSMAVQLARDFNIALIGYVRGRQFAVYSSFDRVVDAGRAS